MYNPPSKRQVLDSLVHLRNLYREILPSNEEERLAQAARETFSRDLISNLHHLHIHPMPHVISGVSQHFVLTMDGAHRLFGYDLSQLQDYDQQLNGSRTRIIESYAFQRDFRIDLPSHFGNDGVFERNALLRELVSDWQTDVPIRTLERRQWQFLGKFYVQVGTEDSLGASIPPGAIASVQPATDEEQLRPDPKRTYLLQFGCGYWCGRCVVSQSKLSLILDNGAYDGPYEFRYPENVRIAGRIGMFVTLYM